VRYPAIDNPTSCKICIGAHFIHAKNMSEETVRQWCRMLKDVHDEERSGQPSVVSNDLVESVDEEICKDGASQFQSFRVNFHKFHILSSMRLSELG
jgi:hypothetical protein